MKNVPVETGATKPKPVVIDVTDDFQARATREGKAAQAIAEDLLLDAGFELVQKTARLRGLGVSIDYVMQDKSGEEWYFDVSGAFTTTRGGLIRADTLWKGLGRANVVMSNDPEARLIFLTSHLPKKGSEGDLALRTVGAGKVFDAMEMFSDDGRSRLVEYASGEHRPLPGFWTEDEIDDAFEP